MEDMHQLRGANDGWSRKEDVRFYPPRTSE
jgi:hypothetical protein